MASRPGWRPTAALVRATLAATVLGLLAVTLHRPDLLVLAAPLLVVAVGGLLTRPEGSPRVRSRLGLEALREGEGTTLTVELEDASGVEHVALAAVPHRWVSARPATGLVAVVPPRGAGTLQAVVTLVSLRWGRRPFGDAFVGATSPWAGYRWGPAGVPPRTLTTLPLPAPFDSRAASPHPLGLVGVHPARRRGDGYEFDSIRPFRTGDRLRRVHWRVSLRTGALHVTSTLAEEDASVLLLVDGGVEVGAGHDLAGAPSSLDVAVRAAGAVAEHHLTRGDRVGVRVLGSTGRHTVPTAAGRVHLRRVLETLARVVPGEGSDPDPQRMRFAVPAGAVVLVFSPMLSRTAVAATTVLASRGVDVVVVDCLPEDVDPGAGDADRAVAWRIRLLERRALLARVERSGIPVVAWRGPGTLDVVLRRLRQRSTVPSVVRR